MFAQQNIFYTIAIWHFLLKGFSSKEFANLQMEREQFCLFTYVLFPAFLYFFPASAPPILTFFQTNLEIKKKSIKYNFDNTTEIFTNERWVKYNLF